MKLPYSPPVVVGIALIALIDETGGTAGDGGPGGPLKAVDDMQHTTVTAVTAVAAVALLCRYSINALASSTPSRIKADFVRRSHKAVLSLVGFRILGAGCFSCQSQRKGYWN